jgi:hypothetical protein
MFHHPGFFITFSLPACEINRQGNKKKGSPAAGVPLSFAVFRDCYCWKDCENPCAALDR